MLSVHQSAVGRKLQNVSGGILKKVQAKTSQIRAVEKPNARQASFIVKQ